MGNKFLVAMLCGVSTLPVSWQAKAQTQGHTQALTQQFNIPAGNLKQALDLYRQQTNIQLIYRPQEVAKGRSAGVSGLLSREAGLNAILADSGFKQHRDNSGAIAIVSNRAAAAALTTEEPLVPTVPGEADANAASPDDIVVTARRRSETSMAVPVVLTGISQEEIERRHLTRMDELNNVVPQLQIGGGAAIQGGSIVLRGVGANANTTTADQGVTFNIDGAQVARSSIRRIGQMDMAQIEVLKGPQALFFGKNSPGGVISIRTADPTRQFEAKAAALYEFVGREAQFDGYVSGPLTDTLGVRVAVRASHMAGWQKNIYPSNLPFALSRKRLPHDREAAARLTLKFDPSDKFDARFKFNYGKVKTAGASETKQYTYCPLGIPQLPLGVNGSGEDCKADDRISYNGFGPSFEAFGLGEDGKPEVNQSQLLSSLELNYRPTDTLTLTSLSSLYYAKIDWVDPYFTTTNPDLVIVGDYHPRIREISKELRLASSFDGPINFLAGGYLQDSEFYYVTQDVGGANNPVSFGHNKLDLDGSHVSVFGQLRVNPVETIELSGGGRYSWERKRAVRTNLLGGGPPSDDKREWTNFSPEITGAWRPSSKLTMFASYKRGFLSGGFAPSGAHYDQQITKGFEGGVKTSLFGNRLRANISAYRYVSTGLQITIVRGIQFETTNAGQGIVKGIEADFNWRTGVEGLTLRSAVGYNRARFDTYTAGCYPGQSIAAGCNIGLLPSGAFSLQDLRGRPFTNAPDWAGNAGVDFERQISGDWRLGLSADASYSSSYYTQTNLAPSSKHDGFWLLDASLRLTSRDDRWQLALLGRNLTNEYTFQNSFSVLFTGSGTGTAGPTVDADRYAFINRGRQVALQITRRFGAQ